ncbi:MAG TPA: RNA polymerase sigma factor [Candidatus Moranbacteria bacterium]|nr:RNA polymerase sigma factor [Candidatus Moranbacteria bacterium]
MENKNLKNKTDEELAGLTKINPDFYLPLMERYEDKILRYIRRITNVPKETAEDLGQEIFIKAYENINDFDEKLKFSSWLYRIAHNHVISFWRKTKKERNVFSWDGDESFKNILESDHDMVKDLDRKITAEKMAQVLELTRPEYKEVLVLKYMEGKDYAEISDILRKPIGTIGTMISRAKKDIQKKIKKNNIKLIP